MSMAQNLFFSVLGDSISTLHGLTPTEGAFYHTAFSRMTGIASPSDTWWMKLIERLEGSLLVNNSYAGSNVCPNGYQPACAPWRLSKLQRDGITPDAILIYTGLNDVAFSRTPSEFQEAYLAMLETLKSSYPLAQIWCGTLCKGKLPTLDTVPFINWRDCTPLSEYNEAIRSAVQQAGCRLADLAAFAQEYASLDGVHPNAEGMAQLSELWLRCMLSAETEQFR